MPPLTPIPSPWKTLRRTAARLALALLALILIWSLWYAYAAYRLNAKLAQYRAQGYPTTKDQLDENPTLPKDCRQSLIFAAATATPLTQTDRAFLESFLDSPDVTPAPSELQTFHDLLQRQAPALDLLRKAGSAPMYTLPAKPTYTICIGPLTPCRRLMQFLYAAAIYYHAQHQDRLAIDAIRDIHLIAATCDGGRAFIGHLVASLGYSDAAVALFRIAPAIHLASADNSNGVPRAQILDLIHELLDPEPFQKNLVPALVSIRIEDSVFRPYDDDRETLLLRPAYRLSRCRELADDDACISALGPGIPSAPSAHGRFPLPFIRHYTNLENAAFPIGRLPLWSALRIPQHYTTLTNRQAAALRLALRLYELDHHGNLPATLAELIPDYLPAPPIDFFRRDSGPLTYVPERRLFYSVNEDGIDDGGKLKLKPGQILVDWNQPDAVFPLDLPPRPSATATQKRSPK